MIEPGFLSNPDVRRWLNGIEPAWTMLDFGSYAGLHQEPSATNRSISLEPNLTETDLAGSAVTSTALILLRHAAEPAGLKLTATGNLARAVVAQLVEVTEWPDFDRSEFLRFHKVVNEPDFLPVHFVRILLQRSKLVRNSQGKLITTSVGNKLLVPERHGALQALLFHIASWHLNLGYFDRNPLESWPQNDIGVVLWSLSASANDWMQPGKLTRLCTVPVIGVLESTWDVGSFAMESRILRPLTWFGCMESRLEREAGLGAPRLYRKTQLFDRFIKFGVQIETPLTQH